MQAEQKSVSMEGNKRVHIVGAPQHVIYQYAKERYQRAVVYHPASLASKGYPEYIQESGCDYHFVVFYWVPGDFLFLPGAR